MSEVSNPTAGSHEGASVSHWAGRALRLLVWSCAAVAAGFAFKSYMDYRPTTDAKIATDESTVRSTGLIAPATKHLASQFSDAQGRLLADPPSSPSLLLDPQTIVVGHWENSDSETTDIPWDQFEKHLALVTGRKVQDLKFDNSPAQIEQIKAGTITLVALHAADAPFLVNNCGYEPAAVLAEEGSTVSGNHLDLIVPTQSTITRSSDLRGHTLFCVVPSSVTGYRAAITHLMQDEGLRPNVDYFINWTLKQKASIMGVAQNKFEAASVSDDKLQTLQKAGKINPSQYRIIYQSEVIPRLTIGWFYNLNPQLAGKINEAILSFHPEKIAAADSADSDSETDAAALSVHFVPVDYKKDFQLVRQIDDSFDPRLDSKAAKSVAATTQETPAN